MIISIDDLKRIYTNVKLDNYSDERITQKLNAIETLIRQYTNNNFQNRHIRTYADCLDGVIYGDFKKFKVGDTVEISQGINKGLYVVDSIDDVKMVLDKELYDDKEMLFTKVIYPYDVIECAVTMLDYDLNVKKNSKLNVSSESISRHSVSYKSGNEINGYPVELMSALKGYCLWRT